MPLKKTSRKELKEKEHWNQPDHPLIKR